MIFRFRSRDRDGQRASGHVEAVSQPEARAFLDAQGHERIRLQVDGPRRGNPAEAGVILFIFLVASMLVLATITQWREREALVRLRDYGRTARGIISGAQQGTTSKGRVYTDYEYTFTEEAGGIHRGAILDAGGTDPARGRMALRSFGRPPQVGQAVTVTYLPENATTHLPVAVTSDVAARPLRQMFIMQAILGVCLVGLVFLLRHLRRARRRKASETDLSSPAMEPGFVNHVYGVLIPEDPPCPVVVMEDGRMVRRLRVARVRAIGGRSQFLGLLGALAYYAVSLACWAMTPSAWLKYEAGAGGGAPFQAGLSLLILTVGLSVLVVPALLIAYAFRAGPFVMALVAASVLAVHAVLLYTATRTGASAGLPAFVFQSLPGIAWPAWILSAAAMIAVLHNRALHGLLRLETPLYEDPE